VAARESLRSRPYHHGNLRRALLDEATKAIAQSGPAGLSLRELARRVGVSHAAPAHHFGDKRGLLTAIAAEGYRLLGAALKDAYDHRGSFMDVGVAYVRFAVQHKPYFEVMFRPHLYRASDAELDDARKAARQMLYGPVSEMSGDDHDFDALRAGVAAWSLVHGLATLYINDALPAELGHDPERITESVAAYLFRSPP
jgi:AcrR family transcriptional regulator